MQLKTALVTGGAARIGRSIVEDLARNGFRTIIHANSSIERARTLANELNDEGCQSAAIQADLMDFAAVSELIAHASKMFGPIDLLVNNASVFRDDDVCRFDTQTFDAHFDVHVKAPTALIGAFAEALPMGHEGVVVNMIDQRVRALNPRFFSYTLSKSALWTATQTLAQALAPRIRINAIGPGPTLANYRQAPEDFQQQIDGLLLKRGPALSEFGKTIRYFYETPSVTGQLIALDGGQHLAWETPDVANIVE